MHSLSVALITVSVIFPLLALSAVALRIWARLVSRTSFNASDYVILMTLVNFPHTTLLAIVLANIHVQVPAVGQAILSIVGATIGGLGTPLASLSPSVRVVFMKVQSFHQS